MTQGFLETFSAELRSEKWNRGGGWIGLQVEINERKI